MRNPAIGTRKAHPCRVSLQALPMTEEGNVTCRCRGGAEQALECPVVRPHHLPGHTK